MTKKVKQTDEYKKWKRIVKGAMLFKLEQHYEELRALHDARTSPYLHNAKISGEKLVKASAKDTGARHRATALMMQAKRNLNGVQAANKAMRNFIISERLAQGATVAERNNAVDLYIQKGLDFEEALDNFIEIAQDLIADCDAAGWSLRRMIDATNIASKPEHIL